MHHRLGKNSNSTEGGFQPCRDGSIHASSCPSQWLLVARPSISEHQCFIHIVAFPGLCHDDDSNRVCRPSYYLSAFIEVPCHYHLVELKFYGDDGNSSLTSFSYSESKEEDKLDNIEGNQALIALVGNKSGSSNVNKSGMSGELLYFKYDFLNFRKIELPKDIEESRKLIVVPKTSEEQITKMSFQDTEEEIDIDADHVVSVRRKQCFIHRIYLLNIFSSL